VGLAVAIGALWGFGEATLFFIVPDVYITLLAIQGTSIALIGSAAAVAGALVGGAIMFRWGGTDPVGAQSVMQRLPAIDAGEIAKVTESMGKGGLGVVFLGPLRGTPYKIYAVEAGQRELSLPAFLLISVPARGVRFVLAALLASWLAGGPLSGWATSNQVWAVIGFWVVFYAFYFWAKGRGARSDSPESPGAD
jgi:membrane protein YqaA with SNARE-associated domain